MSDASNLVANISPENEDALQELSSALDLYEGEFKLLLARCNYQNLRDRLILHLKEIHPQPIHEIRLPRSQKDLYNYIINQVKSENPVVLSIVGLDELDDLHAALLDINLNREMFRNHCPYPIVWWISDSTHKQIIRTAPDFESWTTTLEYAIAAAELLTSLQNGSEELFRYVLTKSEVPFFQKLEQIHLGSIQCSELEMALTELSNYGLNLEPKLQANINFIRGLNTLPPNNSPDKALQYLQVSLTYWQQIQDLERCGLLLNQIGQLNYQINNSEKYRNRVNDWELAKVPFQTAVKMFERANRSDLVADVILRLAVIAKRMSDWEEVEKIVQKALPLHLESRNSYYLASDYQYLAQLAIQKKEWEVAKTNAQRSLEFLVQVPEAEQEWRNLYLFTLAQAEINLGNSQAALKVLLEAERLGDLGHPQIYIAILRELRSLYTQQKQYLEAYITKQEQYAIEQQYGYRAFIGAGRLQGKKSEGKSQTDVATEIEASGRKHDLDELITRIAKPSYKLIVLYGKSGVGKSSLVNAGLIPKLEHTSFEGKDVCAIALRVYTNWEEELEKSLSSTQARSSLPLLERGALDDFNNQVPLSKGDVEGRGIEPMLIDEISVQVKGLAIDGIIAKLREKEAQNLRLVLIFDQFEEFFFVYYNQPTERRKFFEFIGSLLNDSQNLSSLKVVLSLREDYIHYLLECNQIKSMAAIDQDILSKNVLYRIGNLKVEAAKSLIQTLTEKSRFYLEPELIGAIADDLKDELGEVRPIELQVVGAQLQQEGIKTLANYRQLGANPKAILVERYLDNVIVDCGKKNQRLAKFLLFMLTDEKGTRPLRTRVELEKDLQDLLAEMHGDTSALDLVLEIFVRSGLVVLIPESPLDRYQLVHDYLAEFIRASQAPEMAKLQQELAETKETLKETVDRLSTSLKEEETAKLAARKRSRLAFRVGIMASVMAIGAVVAGLFVWKSSVDQEFVSASYKMQSLLNSDLQLDALVEAVDTVNRLQQSRSITSSDTKLRVITSMQEVLYSMKEKNRLLGHSNEVWSVAFSHDGKKLVTASADKTVKLWSIEGKELKTFKGHREKVTSVAFSPDDKKLATASADKTVKLWSVDGKELKTFKDHSDEVLSVTFSPDGKTLATASKDKTVKLWSIDGKELQTFKGHSDEVLSVTFSPDGKTLATASKDKTVKLWSIDGKELKTFKGHLLTVASVAFSPNGMQLATASEDNTVKLWSIDGKEVQIFKGHSDEVLSVAFSPDGKKLATASKDNTVKLWSINGKELQTFKGHSRTVRSVAFSPDGKQLATASNDKTVKLWIIDGKELPTFKGHSDEVWFVTFSPNSEQLVTGSKDNTVKLWSIDGKLLQTFKGHRGLVGSISFSRDGTQLATASADKTVKLWSIDGKLLQTLKGHSDGVNSVEFSPDGKQLVTASSDKTVKLWGINDKGSIDELQTLITGHTDVVWNAAFSPDGKQLATASKDKTVKLWSVNKNGRHIDENALQTLKGHNDEVWTAIFSPDSKQLVTASADNIVKLWSLDGTELHIFKGHSSGVGSVRFSRYGRQLATASDDRTIKLWSIDGELLQTLKGHTRTVTSVAFSRSDKQLESDSRKHFAIATTSFDKTIKLWSFDLASLKGVACYWLQDYITTTLELQKKLATCGDPQILKAAAPALIAEARTKGMSGNPESALSLFQDAKKLDPSISLDPQAESNLYFINKGERLAREGDIKAALDAYKEVFKRNPNIKISADSWDVLCRNGSLYNAPSQVIFACDKAVNLEPDNLNIRQNRGIAKELSGNSNGATTEFEISLSMIYRETLEDILSIKTKNYIPKYKYSEQLIWLKVLKEGKNPFTDEKLEAWRQQENKF